MKLLLCSLLLASHCALSSRSTFVVTQSADFSVKEGETVNITCCWTLESKRFRVNWMKQDTELESFNFKNHSQGSNCSHLTLSNVTRKDSGRYICKVIMEIPVLTINKGNGTVITVIDNTEDNTTRGQDIPFVERPVIICLAMMTPLLLITLFCFCCLRRRQARVIYEVPHIDSEEVEMDKHSTSSSTGSSQWCQVPVYESFDYFERVENKESE